jgi:hypothetical protein
MFDKKDIENIGMEFERGLKLGAGDFTDEQVLSLRTALELAMTNTLRMIENRVELKKTQTIKIEKKGM